MDKIIKKHTKIKKASKKTHKNKTKKKAATIADTITFKERKMSKKESTLPYTKVVVHPIVLLSVVDHYTRMTKIQSPDKRVVGILLGNINNSGVVDVLSSYAVPFDEDENVWFFDHNYHEALAEMSLKVNCKYIYHPKNRTHMHTQS